MKAFMAAIGDVQSKLKAPKTQNNDFQNFRYRSCEDILEAVKPLLAPRGLVLSLADCIEQVGDRYYVKSTATLTDGEHTLRACAYAREPAAKKGMDESQITGAASSYARKYALSGLLCIDDEKDADANERAKQLTQAEPDSGAFTCEACGKAIAPTATRSAEAVAQATRRRYGKAFCTKCAVAYQKRLDEKSGQEGGAGSQG